MSNASVQPPRLSVFEIILGVIGMLGVAFMVYHIDKEGYQRGLAECSENCKSDALPNGAMLIEAYQASVEPTITPSRKPRKLKPVVKAQDLDSLVGHGTEPFFRPSSYLLCGCPKDLDQPVMLRAEPRGVRWIELPEAVAPTLPVQDFTGLYEDTPLIYSTPTAAPALPVDNPGAFITPGYGWLGPVGRFAQPEVQVNAVVATPEPGTFFVAGVVLMGIGWRLSA